MLHGELDELVPPAEADALLEIPVEDIEVNPNQPRKLFSTAALDELAASIRSTASTGIALMSTVAFAQS